MSEQCIPEDQIVPHGQKIYERSVRPELGPEDKGKFVVINVLGGTHAVDDNEEETFVRASGRADPEALFYFARVGADGAPVPAHRIGAF
jgi:hypothetical protein